MGRILCLSWWLTLSLSLLWASCVLGTVASNSYYCWVLIALSLLYPCISLDISSEVGLIGLECPLSSIWVHIGEWRPKAGYVCPAPRKETLSQVLALLILELEGGALCKMTTLITGFGDKPIRRFKSFYSFHYRSKWLKDELAISF